MLQSISKKNKIIIYLILLFILSTTSGKFHITQNNYLSTDTKISVVGLSNIENFNISNELSNFFNKNMLFIDKEKIHDIMNKYNVIEEYNIKRIYPYAINIKIIPTKYLARTSYNNQLLVGANGKLVNDKENTEILPYIFGEFNSKNFLSLKKNVEQSKFTFKEFKTLYFFQSNRWDILTNNDILIKLPLNFTLESLNLAYKIIGNDKIKKKIIDLRIKNHLVIK